MFWETELDRTVQKIQAEERYEAKCVQRRIADALETIIRQNEVLIALTVRQTFGRSADAGLKDILDKNEIEKFKTLWKDQHG